MGKIRKTRVENNVPNTLWENLQQNEFKGALYS